MSIFWLRVISLVFVLIEAIVVPEAKLNPCTFQFVALPVVIAPKVWTGITFPLATALVAIKHWTDGDAASLSQNVIKLLSFLKIHALLAHPSVI